MGASCQSTSTPGACYTSGMDLFDHALRERLKTEAPLTARTRSGPQTLDEFVGQDEIVAGS